MALSHVHSIQRFDDLLEPLLQFPICKESLAKDLVRDPNLIGWRR